MASVDEIKSRIDITDVVERYLSLERAGKNYKARCPFHNERTPSFNVSPHEQMFYCFGCGAGGDAVSFVERMEGLDFTGAMHVLAEHAGLTFDAAGGPSREERTELYTIMDAACRFYEDQLTRYPEAGRYLAQRGISDASVQVWRIGYAPAPEEQGWRALKQHLFDKGFSEELMREAGLIKDPSSGHGSAFDTFRGRIIFPISDPSGRVVGFSGRLTPAQERQASKAPKYLNSPDTPIFHKSHILYGLDRAKQAIRTMGFSVLVEGQVDLLMSHQRGFQNTVATSGTAVTVEHLRRLKRLSPKLMCAFDADEAGVHAVERTAAQALALGMEVKVATVPSDADPAELLSEDPGRWKQVLSGAVHVITFLCDTVIAGTNDERTRVTQVHERVLPYIAALTSKSEQSYFVSLVAGRVNVREDALWADLERTTPAGQGESDSAPAAETATQSAPAPASDGPTAGATPSRRDTVAGHIAGLIAWQRSRGRLDPDPETLSGELRERLGEEADQLIDQAAADNERLLSIEHTYGDEELSRREINELLRELDIAQLSQQFMEAQQALTRAEEQGDEDTVQSMLQRCSDLRTRIDTLKGSHA